MNFQKIFTFAYRNKLITSYRFWLVFQRIKSLQHIFKGFVSRYYRSSPLNVLCKSVLRNLAKFTGKTPVSESPF